MHVQASNTASRHQPEADLHVQLRGDRTGNPALRLLDQPPLAGPINSMIAPDQRAAGDYLFAVRLTDLHGAQVVVTTRSQPPIVFSAPW